MPETADPTAVPGLAETRLDPAYLAALPATASAAPAPWHCRIHAVTWLQRAHHPPFAWRGPRLPFVTVALVDYEDSPVGPYHEVVAGAALRRGVKVVGQVPFIAVDSAASVLGGRVNWALPKTTAAFDGSAAAGTVVARGDGWSVSARTSRHRGPRLPVRLAFRTTGPLGDYVIRLRGTGHPVVVHAAADGPTLTSWLGAGRRLGLALTGEMFVGPPSQPPR